MISIHIIYLFNMYVSNYKNFFLNFLNILNRTKNDDNMILV